MSTILPDDLDADELLRLYTMLVKCQHYCPVECTHECEYSIDELEGVIYRKLVRADNGF